MGVHSEECKTVTFILVLKAAQFYYCTVETFLIEQHRFFFVENEDAKLIKNFFEEWWWWLVLFFFSFSI